MSRSILALCLLIQACGGTTSTGSGNREPKLHRASATACQAPAPMGPAPAPGPDPYRPCASDAECIYGFNGRCEQQRGGMFCVYDECYSDDQCTGGAVC